MEIEKQKLITIIKEWIINDDELKKIQTLSKEKREKKKILTAILIEEMKKSNVDEYKTGSGKLIKTSIKNKKA